jgi:hypothetical protein
MLSFTPSQKKENRLKILQGLLVETYKDLEALSPDETKYIHRCAFISNIRTLDLGPLRQSNNKAITC